MTAVGRVAEIWRYPVKSMGGEPLEEVELGEEGIPGDRVVQVRDARGTLGALGVPGERTRQVVRLVKIGGPAASGDLAGELDGLPQRRPPRAAVGRAAR